MQDTVLIIDDEKKLCNLMARIIFREIKKIRPAAEVISLTAFGIIADGIMAMRKGASGYITKGDDNDKIIPIVYKAKERASGKSCWLA